MPPIPPHVPSIPLKERTSLLFLEYGELDVIDGAFVLVDARGVRVQIPIGGVACLMLEPGTRVSHAAAKLAAQAGCLLVWVGEAGVRLYSAGYPGGARSDRLLYQASIALDPEGRRRVVRKMFEIRFGEHLDPSLSINQMRGLEGVRVRNLYEEFARRYRVRWEGRRYDPHNWSAADLPNRCLSAGTACLYGIVEAGILAAGYSPSIGFLHTGNPLSFVFDIADLFKFETVVPAAFEVAGSRPVHPERQVRQRCRDLFREQNILERIIPTIQEVLAASGMPMPKPYEDAVLPAFEKEDEDFE
ncbi:MAG: type I-E CRISPR-associated endonuclease Cas1e [Methanolinea sp.]|nr:type I-E CRISPR-associated endonuclease Cas1e [Methanolinea sp.]